MRPDPDECDHGQTVQILGPAFKCSLCGSIVYDDDIPAPDFEAIQARRERHNWAVSKAIDREKRRVYPRPYQPGKFPGARGQRGPE